MHGAYRQAGAFCQTNLRVQITAFYVHIVSQLCCPGTQIVLIAYLSSWIMQLEGVYLIDISSYERTQNRARLHHLKDNKNLFKLLRVDCGYTSRLKSSCLLKESGYSSRGVEALASHCHSLTSQSPSYAEIKKEVGSDNFYYYYYYFKASVPARILTKMRSQSIRGLLRKACRLGALNTKLDSEPPTMVMFPRATATFASKPGMRTSNIMQRPGTVMRYSQDRYRDFAHMIW